MLVRWLSAAVLLALPAGAGATDLAMAGADHLQPFKRQLLAALDEGLAAGPVAAIGACRVRAPEIAAGLRRDGVRVGRSSHRLRNTANAAPDWVAPVMNELAGRERGVASAQVVELGPARAGYIEPIYVQPKCLLCHGEELAPEVAAQIHLLYSDDRATGFRAGDFRGVFWVEFPVQ